ncbi:DUF1365 domain-containing protein [Eleftheria terrae]|uniref:DUF1365 domain-containing protein n=1 Tax=Eleftheria terrae TaxID=1597781 RepID=UPI00263B75B6|nr:DUF1365 domain-containing protein [Eleftheria terrae]WKB50940.1 DUF1365 domain-containing protein [Eleftheria terrae]
MTGGALIGFGQVRHRRLRPVAHAFAYRSYFLLLPMRQLREQPDPALCRNRFGALTFHDRDHGDGSADSLLWLESVLARAGVFDADGEVWLHTYPRVLGYAFKPVSFWYAERRDGSLAAVVVEVNNTFGERHCYLLKGPALRWGAEQLARKAFHVSPFCKVEGGYRFRFLRTAAEGPHAGRTVVRIDHDDAQGPLLQTSISGTLEALTPASARRAWLGLPLMTVGVIVRIHWQALRLWAKRVPFFSRPQAFAGR